MARKKISKGLESRKRVICLVEALLKLAYNDQEVEGDDSKTVKVEWIETTNLQVTGYQHSEGATLDNLHKLVAQHDNFKKKEYVRNALLFLEDEELLEDLRKKKSTDGSTSKKYQSTNSPYWKFKLKLKGEGETLDNNIRYVRETLELPIELSNMSAIKAEDKTQSQNVSNDNLDYQIAVNLLRSLDCKCQVTKFQNKTRDSKIGFFLIQFSSRDICYWLVWRLEKHIAHSHNAQKIPISVTYEDCGNDIWERFYSFPNGKNKASSKDVIEYLTNFYKQKTVIIYITNSQGFSDEQLNNLSNFWQELLNNLNIIAQELNHKFFFILFLIDLGNKSKNDTSTNYLNNKRFIKLELTKFSRDEVQDWLNDTDMTKNKFETSDKFRENLDKIVDNPMALIDAICVDVFKLNSGIEEIKHNWSNFAST